MFVIFARHVMKIMLSNLGKPKGDNNAIDVNEIEKAFDGY